MAKNNSKKYKENIKQSNSKYKGHNDFTYTEILEVWGSIPECAGKKECKDPWGREINRFDYGKKSSKGWNIDHVLPISRGGTNNKNNLQPLHWKSNKEKSDSPNCEKWTKC